jgi:hypothetical protein
MGGQAGGRGAGGRLRSPERGNGWAPWRAHARKFTGPSGKNHSLSFKMSLMISFNSLSIGRPAALARSIAATILLCNFRDRQLQPRAFVDRRALLPPAYDNSTVWVNCKISPYLPLAHHKWVVYLLFPLLLDMLLKPVCEAAGFVAKVLNCRCKLSQ